MATRFYFDRGVAAPVSPDISAAWEDGTQGGIIARLLYKNTLEAQTLLGAHTVNVPITTTQDILVRMLVSEPIPAQEFRGTVSMVVRASESGTSVNATLAAIFRIVSQDGTTPRGTLFNTFSSDTEFGTTSSTRLVTNQPVATIVTQPGDRIVVELGVHVATPLVSGTATLRLGTTGTSDFALTSGLTTDLNPWVEFSQDIFGPVFNNYHGIGAGDGLSVGEKIR